MSASIFATLNGPSSEHGRINDEAARQMILMAAAQDLLDALRELVELEPANSADFEGEREKYESARAAIAKATGAAA